MVQDLAEALAILKRSEKILRPVLDGFDRRLKQYGAHPKSAFWKDAERQTRRYQILSRLFHEEDRNGGITITDFGCGYGAFFDYLEARPVMEGSRYMGIDMSAGMIAEAQRRIRDPRATFHHGLIAAEDADYTFACGTYNMNMNAGRDEWAAYIKASLVQLWSRTRKSLGFNLLSASADEKYPGLYYTKPAPYVDFCRLYLSPDITITDDRPLPDFTIFVRRERKGRDEPWKSQRPEFGNFRKD
ncbi:MAG: methyltransferase domain-containing protein [Proteobacteria bacterium]|nr:methyltransferase domain-containing protein [Pseudomonadota bacterium]